MRKVALGSWPTPVEPMPRLAAHLGLAEDALWLKRDDLTGLGGGGNKVRKLEYLCGDALEQGADLLITSGAAQSNHARLTAAAGARLGLDVVLVLWGDPPDVGRGNLVLDTILGARLVWAGGGAVAGLVEQVADHERAAGRRPYVVPYGGSSAVGAAGYRECAVELEQQLSDLDLVVTAVGSGGTMAGLVAGLGAHHVSGVDTGATDDGAAAVSRLLHDMGIDAVPAVTRRHVGAGYAVLAPQVRDAIELVARTEGVVLDPVYTGRAAAEVVALADRRALPARTVLLHSGGLPGLFGHAEAARAEVWRTPRS